MVLKGAVHLSDYVTKVVKKLIDQSVDPKTVLEFVISVCYHSSYDYCPLTMT